VPFARDGARGARGKYTARAEHCGWPGMLHGGVAFALMDEALAYALYFQQLYGVTARAETRFRQPIAPGAKLIIRAWTLEQRRRLVDARAEIRLEAEGNPLVAEADATMYLQEMESPSEPRPPCGPEPNRS
jgi:acyl-coenzyme A thioesterase PaaI-like protein